MHINITRDGVVFIFAAVEADGVAVGRLGSEKAIDVSAIAATFAHVTVVASP